MDRKIGRQVEAGQQVLMIVRHRRTGVWEFRLSFRGRAPSQCPPKPCKHERETPVLTAWELD